VYNLDMDEQQLKLGLKELNLPGIRYYAEVGSTNDIALDWAADDAFEFSLVVAKKQTSGRGRMDRRWFMEPEDSLAFSVVFRPRPEERIPMFSLLGGVAVCDFILHKYNLPATIKWPNDVLIHNNKVCGVLAETRWEDQIPDVVLGIGVNVGKGSIPKSGQIHFPATSLETETGWSMDRIGVLSGIMEYIIHWRRKINTSEFISFWRNHLAFKNQHVQVILPWNIIQGIQKGINEEGDLLIRQDDGKTILVKMGEVQLRPTHH
jgi:BirA family biotin operon repressor/biotin-[acetyl-CoA-carboxylase] ligase